MFHDLTNTKLNYNDMKHPSKNREIMSPITVTSTRNQQNNYSIPFFERRRNADIPAKEAHDQQPENDFFKSIKGFLKFGKLIGVLPFSGMFGKSWKDLSFR